MTLMEQSRNNVVTKEVEEGTVSVRSRKNVNLGAMPVEDFIKMAKDEIDSKKRD